MLKVTWVLSEIVQIHLQYYYIVACHSGSYLRINPATLESLTRSGTEASASRARKADVDTAIREDEPHSSHTDPGITVFYPLPANLTDWSCLNYEFRIRNVWEWQLYHTHHVKFYYIEFSNPFLIFCIYSYKVVFVIIRRRVISSPDKHKHKNRSRVMPSPR